MVDVKGLAHFTIPVSDIERSKRFYADIVGCKYIGTAPGGKLAFLDAGGVCLLLAERKGPINPVLDTSSGVHHSFIIASDAYPAALDHLRANNVEIFFEEDRRGGVVNGPRAYFRDPDGTVLEFIDLTSYDRARNA
jgi:catechol 2,3-dioxygenase-like lactoylglutathione lyase family enzyme